MKHNKKHLTVGATIAALLFLTPIIVYAIMLSSEKRVNSFQPASQELQIAENNGSSVATQTKEMKWGKTDTQYTVSKLVTVGESSNPNGEYLRVRFVPAWYDSAGYLWAGVDGGITDIRSMVLNDDNPAQATALLIKNGKETPETIATLTLVTGWNNKWEYVGNGCFKSKQPIRSDDSANSLLSEVTISENVYQAAHTASLTMHLDVLADSIQTVESGATVYNPRWNATITP